MPAVIVKLNELSGAKMSDSSAFRRRHVRRSYENRFRDIDVVKIYILAGELTFIVLRTSRRDEND